MMCLRLRTGSPGSQPQPHIQPPSQHWPQQPGVENTQTFKFPSRDLLLAASKRLLGCQSQQTPGLDKMTRRMLSRCVS